MNIQGVVIMVILAVSCNQKPLINEELKDWLGMPMSMVHIENAKNTYHLFDTTGAKVGSMIFSIKREGNKLIAIDTSQLDDGSLFETIVSKVDLRKLEMESIKMDILTPALKADLKISRLDESLEGSFVIKQDTSVRSREIDSIYNYDIFRTEIFMLLNTITLNPGDSIPFQMFVSNMLTTLDCSLVYKSSETVEVPAGVFEADVIKLNTPNGILDNTIWVSKNEPRKIVNFYTSFLGGVDIPLMSSVPLD